MGGGLFGLGVLSPAPTEIHLNLNEWIRFDQPGSYIVVVTSHRVADTLDADRTMSHPSNFTLKSNPFTSRSFRPSVAGKGQNWHSSSTNSRLMHRLQESSRLHEKQQSPIYVTLAPLQQHK
jgi:hypothetical protein